MFSGIISEVGTIASVEAREGGLRLSVACGFSDVAIGESVAVNGVCLTAVEVIFRGPSPALYFDLSAETVSCTASRWKAGEQVNLERALKLGDRLSGHLVSGHVDGVAVLEEITPDGQSFRLRLRAPEGLSRFIAQKGSVTLDGVSLTVNAVEGAAFTVAIIPHTWQATTLSQRKSGEQVNLEVDLIARYLERLSGRA